MKQLHYSLLLFICLASCKTDQKQKHEIDNNNIVDKDYFDYSINTANKFIDSLDGYLNQWRQNFGFDDAGNLKTGASEVYLAALCANLYELNKNEKYLDAAKKIIINYEDYRALAGDPKKLRPEYEAGIPPISNFFLPPKYARAAQVVKNSGTCGKEEVKTIDRILSETAEFTLRTQEWGPMNRAMLRAEGLLLTCLVVDQHEHKQQWSQMGTTILEDNMTNWSIEDAGMYNMIWLYSLCGYYGYHPIENRNLNNPYFHYYLEYFKNLQSPAGVIPDFGDGWWRSWWYAAVPVFEMGAKTFNNPEFKWIAENTFYNNTDFDKKNITLALKFTEAMIWGNSTLESQMPMNGSRQVLDDLAGKKVAFRNGWDDKSTYLLYNYKDQGKNGTIFKRNLSNTLSVSHEKMHHGHSDELSISLLMHNGSILLHDGGYRPKLPSGPNGEWRADIFHNKMVFRSGDVFDSRFEFSKLKDQGFYKESSTENVDFVKGAFCEHSRTKEVIIEKGIGHERIIDYLPNDGIFVVFDLIKSTNQNYSANNLWFSQNIIEKGEHWYLTNYDSIGKWENPGDESLYIIFNPENESEIFTEKVERHKQEEVVMVEHKKLSEKEGNTEVFITVLAPKSSNIEPESVFYKSEISKNAFGTSIIIAADTHNFCHKIDLEGDTARTWPRPKYTFESSKISINEFSSDADFLYVWKAMERNYFMSVNCTKVENESETLFEQAKNTNEFRQDGGATTADAWKVRKIERTVFK
ncbi:MAG: hypothetical protein JXQ87_01005 [Bacteroidia bacterium]